MSVIDFLCPWSWLSLLERFPSFEPSLGWLNVDSNIAWHNEPTSFLWFSPAMWFWSELKAKFLRITLVFWNIGKVALLPWISGMERHWLTSCTLKISNCYIWLLLTIVQSYVWQNIDKFDWTRLTKCKYLPWIVFLYRPGYFPTPKHQYQLSNQAKGRNVHPRNRNGWT